MNFITRKSKQLLSILTFLTLEAEIVLGLPSQLSDGASSDRGGTEREMKAIWAKIQKSFRRLFYENVSTDESSSWKYDRASAWYAVAYGTKADCRNQVNAVTPRGGRFLGFGWIMGDILYEIPLRTAVPSNSFGYSNDTTATERATFYVFLDII